MSSLPPPPPPPPRHHHHHHHHHQFIHKNDLISLQVESLGFVAVPSSFEEPLPECDERITRLRIIPNEKCFQNYPIEFGYRCIFQILDTDYNYYGEDEDFACLRYGQQVKLKHVSSGAFVVGSDMKYVSAAAAAYDDNDNDRVNNYDNDNNNSFAILLVGEHDLAAKEGYSSWVIESRYRYRENGDSVYSGDSITFINNHHRENQKCVNSIKASPNPFQFDHLLCLTANPHCGFAGFVIRVFCSYDTARDREKEHVVVHHDIVRIDHIEACGLLVCDIDDERALSCSLFPLAEICNPVKNKYSVHVREKLPEESSSLSYWQILPETVTSYCCELVYGDRIRLKNLVNGQYLGIKCDGDNDTDVDDGNHPDRLYMPSTVTYPDSRETIFIVLSADFQPDKSRVCYKDNLYLQHEYSGCSFMLRKGNNDEATINRCGGRKFIVECSRRVDDVKANVMMFVKLSPQFIRDVVCIQQCSSVVGISTPFFQITWETDEINQPFFRHFLGTIKSILKWTSKKAYRVLALPPATAAASSDKGAKSSSLSFWMGADVEANLGCRRGDPCLSAPHVPLTIKSLYLEFFEDIKDIPFDELRRKQDIIRNSRLIFHLIHFLEVTFNCPNCFSISENCCNSDDLNLSSILSDCFPVIQLIIASFVYRNEGNSKLLLGINGYLMTTILQSIRYPMCSPLGWLLKTVFGVSSEDQRVSDETIFTGTLISAENLHLLVRMIQVEVSSSNFTAAVGILNTLISLCCYVRPCSELKHSLFSLMRFPAEGATIHDAYEAEVECALFSCRYTVDNKWEVSTNPKLIVEENLAQINDNLTNEINNLKNEISGYADKSWDQKFSMLLNFGFSGASLYECIDRLEFCDSPLALCSVICQELAHNQSYKFTECMLTALLDSVGATPFVNKTGASDGDDVGNAFLTIQSPVDHSMSAQSITDFDTALWSVENDIDDDVGITRLEQASEEDNTSVFDGYLFRFKQCLRARFPHFTFQGRHTNTAMIQSSSKELVVITEDAKDPYPRPEFSSCSSMPPAIWVDATYLFSSNCRSTAKKEYVRQSLELLAKLCNGKSDCVKYHVSKLLPTQLLLELLSQPLMHSDRQTLYQLLLEIYVEDDTAFAVSSSYSNDYCSDRKSYIGPALDDESIPVALRSVGLLFESEAKPYNDVYLWDPACLRFVLSRILISDFNTLNLESLDTAELNFNHTFLKTFFRLLQKGFFEKQYSFVNENNTKGKRSCLSILVKIQQILTSRDLLPHSKEVAFDSIRIMNSLVDKLTYFGSKQLIVSGDYDSKKSLQDQLCSALQIVEFIFDSTQFEAFRNIIVQTPTGPSAQLSTIRFFGGSEISLRCLVYSERFTAMLLRLLLQPDRSVQKSITHMLEHQISIRLERFSNIQIVPTSIEAFTLKVMSHLNEIIREVFRKIDVKRDNVAADIEQQLRYILSTTILLLMPHKKLKPFDLVTATSAGGKGKAGDCADRGGGDDDDNVTDVYGQLDHHLWPMCMRGSDAYSQEMFALLLDRATADVEVIAISTTVWPSLPHALRYIMDWVLKALAFLSSNCPALAEKCARSSLSVFSMRNFNNCDGCAALLCSILRHSSLHYSDISREEVQLFLKEITASIRNSPSASSSSPLPSARLMNTTLAASYSAGGDTGSWMQDYLSHFLLSPESLSKSGFVAAVVFCSEGSGAAKAPYTDAASKYEMESLQLHVLQSLASAVCRGTHPHSPTADPLRAMLPRLECSHFLRSSTTPMLVSSAILVILSRIYTCDEFEFDQIISLSLQRIALSPDMDVCRYSMYDFIFRGVLRSLGYITLYSCKYDPVAAYLDRKICHIACSDKDKEEARFCVSDPRVRQETLSTERSIHSNYETASPLSPLMVRGVWATVRCLLVQMDDILAVASDVRYIYGTLLIICVKSYLHFKALPNATKESKILSQKLKECVPKLLQRCVSYLADSRKVDLNLSRMSSRSDAERIGHVLTAARLKQFSAAKPTVSYFSREHHGGENNLISTNLYLYVKRSIESTEPLDNSSQDAVSILVGYFSSDSLDIKCQMNDMFLRILCSLLDNKLEDIRGDKALATKLRASLLLTEAERLKSVQNSLVQRGCIRLVVKFLGMSNSHLSPHRASNQRVVIPPITSLVLSLSGLLMANRNDPSKREFFSAIKEANAGNTCPDKFCFAYLRVILQAAKEEIEGKRDCNFGLLVEMFSFIYKLCDDFFDNGRRFLRIQFVDKSSYYNTVSINIVQDLADVTAALLVLTITKFKYIRSPDFYCILYPRNDKFIDWFDDEVDFKGISTLLFVLTNAFKALKNVTQGDYIENKVIVMTALLKYIPPLMEYVGTLRTTIITTASNGRKHTWDGANPHLFCASYIDAMRLGRKINENEFMREQREILSYMSKCGHGGQLYGGISTQKFAEVAFECELAFMRLVMSFVERTNDNSITILRSTVLACGIRAFISSAESSLVASPHRHSEVFILYYSFLSTMQRLLPHSSLTIIKSWISQHLASIRSTCGSVEILDKDGSVRVCYFPIPPFVQEYWSYPETRLLRTYTLYNVNRASPEEKIADFYAAMHALIAVMKRQERLRSLLSSPLHSLLGGKKPSMSVRLPDIRSAAFALSACLNVYYSFVISYGATLHEGADSVHRKMWSTDSLQVWRHGNTGYLVFVVKIVHTVLNVLLAARQVINIDSSSSAVDVKSLLLGNAWGAILLVTSALCLFSNRFSSLYAIHLFDVVLRVKIMSFLVTAITRNIRRILYTLLLAMLFMYGFAVVSYLLMRNQYSFNGHYGCSEGFGNCFKNHVDYGLQASPDWGSDSSDVHPTIQGNSDWYIGVIGSVYNLSYVILVNLVLQSIISGLIIDTFSKMREENELVEHDILNRCFICGFDRDYFESRDTSFIGHIRNDHNMWMYVWFYIHLESQDPVYLTSLDNYVLSQFRSKSTFVKTLPVRKCSL